MTRYLTATLPPWAYTPPNGKAAGLYLLVQLLQQYQSQYHHARPAGHCPCAGVNTFQVDDGYQTAVGDWLSVDSKKFPFGMRRVADAVHQRGLKAGLWLAPLQYKRMPIWQRSTRAGWWQTKGQPADGGRQLGRLLCPGYLS